MEGKEKQQIYAKYKISLKNAIKYEFWLQAIFIEYAILEDRTESVILNAGNIKLVNSKGDPLTLSEKLNKIKSCSKFTDKRVRRYLPLDFIEGIYVWKRRRDAVIHNLMNLSIEDEDIKLIALDGQKLISIVDNKVKSVNTLFGKEKGSNNVF